MTLIVQAAFQKIIIVCGGISFSRRVIREFVQVVPKGCFRGSNSILGGDLLR